MSIYDDLADSGYMNKNQLRQHLHMQENEFEQSMSGSNQFVDFNQYADASSVVTGAAQAQNQYGNNHPYTQNKFPLQFDQSSVTPSHVNQGIFGQKYDQPSHNYSNINHLLHLTSSQKPESMGQQAMIHQQVKQDLFRLNHGTEDELCNFEMRNNQQFESVPSQRDFNLDDEDIIQVNPGVGYDQPAQLKTGRFASQQQEHLLNHPSVQNSFTIEQFKNNNDQISQLLQQLQAPAYNPQAQMQASIPLYNLGASTTSNLPPSYNQIFSPNYAYEQEAPMQPSRGITHNQLNQDNSLLALAQRKPLGSSGGTTNNQIDQSPLDNDFFLKESNFYGNQFNALGSQPDYQSNEVNNSRLGGYQPSSSHQRRSSFGEEYGKENVNQNIYNKQKSTKIENSFNYFSEPQPDPRQALQQQQPKTHTNFYAKQHSDNDIRKKELMNNFDDIPIKELNKKTEEFKGNTFDTVEDDGDRDDEGNMTLIEKVDHPKWKVRMRAYKQISELFYNEYSKQCQKKKGTQESQLQTEGDEEEERIFETYGPLMQKIIADSTLTAQFEGLSCLFAYMRFAPDIKNVTFQVHSILLEKVQLNKPSFKEITMKILMCILRRDRAQSILPELLRRFKNKNSKIATFAMEVILEAFRNQSLTDEVNLKTIFKATSENLAQSNKELRDMATDLLKEIYKQCLDDANTFSRNLKGLRPVQLKDIKEMLQDVQKSQSADQVQLFSHQNAQEEKPQYDNQLRAKQKSTKDDYVDTQEDESHMTESESDLLLLLPDNFSEIPYISQINVKKKGMETFNQELEKLIQRKQSVLIKDYSSIFNVVVHMLEDPNSLVFMEAIKNVEYLCILLGKNIKGQKIRQFLSLLTDKYKETKTAVISAVNKTISVLIHTHTLPMAQMIEHMVSGVAHTHKNPRVKQLILDKVDQTLREEHLREEEQVNIFKSIKDKILGFIQKDTNANVRDAAVGLLTTFKVLSPQNQLVTDAINTLPKYRITEINTKAQEQGEQFRAQKEQQQVPPPSRGQSAKSQAKSNQPIRKETPSTQSQPVSDPNDFSYQGRTISGQYQIHLAEIILTLKKMKSGNYPEAFSFQEKCEEVLEKLGEQGIQEAKPVIVSCVYWLLSNSIEKGFRDSEVLNAILILVKKIYCIQRNMETGEDGQSKELQEGILIVLLSVLWIQNQKQSDNLLNVLLSAAENAHTFMQNLLQALTNLQSFPLSSNSVLTILNFQFTWIENKIDNLLAKGMVLSDFEDLRSAGLGFMKDQQEEQVQDQIIQIMVRFKNYLNAKKKEIEYMEQSSIHHSNEQDEEEKGEVQNILSSMPQSPERSKDNNLHMSALSPPSAIKKTKGQEIIEMIDQSFEKGLMMLKELAHTEDAHDPQTKEIIFQKLLSIVEQQCKNPQQQYQQAYALKALMWFKEEVLGLEDCFKYCDQVMRGFARTDLEGRDNSVELYLMNHWVKELSLRDLIDRVSFTCGGTVADQRYFYTLFKWLMNHSLHAAKQEEKWGIEDFRKVTLLLAKNIREDQVREFFVESVDKFGQNKIREFMEIQLMHSPAEYNNFMDWFVQKFKVVSQPQSNEKQKLQLPNINKKPEFDSELYQALRPNQPVEESVCSSARSKNVNHSLYQQMRDKRKTSAQRKQEESESGNKYENIINRLEAQLHPDQSKYQSQSKPQQRATSAYSNVSNRYDIVKTEEDIIVDQKQEVEVEDQQEIEEAQNKLMQSQVKENKYKDEMARLEEERRRIEREREMLLRDKNKETDEWKHKYEYMRGEHEEVIDNLKEANKCYLNQVSENEDLKSQLKLMQEQHLMMMRKFEEIETKLNRKSNRDDSIRQSTTSNKDQVMMASAAKPKKQNIQVVNEDHLQKIEKVFTNEEGQMLRTHSEGEIGIKKIQALLLNSDKNAHEEIGLPLYFYYSKVRSQHDRLMMVQSLNESLNHEDVLYALSNDTYKTVLNFLLKIFALEKAKLEEKAVNQSTQSYRGTQEQNESTVEIQRIVSKLLNSKEFTTSLVTLFQILKVSIPEDLSLELTEEQKQLLRVVMRCVSRITKALHSEHPDLIRAFDVLIEMHKIFTLHPPENLREDLPSLQEFDFVYRTLKDVSDKLMELQPEKVVSFLKFVSEQPPNAFTKYMQQMMQVKYQGTDTQYGDEDDEY